MTTSRTFLFAAALALTLTACGGDGGDAPAEPADAPASAAATEAAAGGSSELRIAGFQFSEVTAAPGAEVAVSNADDATHTVSADDGSFDVRVDGGAEATFTAPDAPGDYAFMCKIHPTMEGTLTVE